MPKYTTQMITIKPELKEWLRQYAKNNHTSMSKIINRQIRKLRRIEETKKNETSLIEHAEEYKLYA